MKISGAKNSALAIIAGSLLCPEDCRIRNVPSLVDVTRMGQILLALGVKLDQNGDILDINASGIRQSQAPYELVSQLRASFFVIGPLLARLGVAQIPLPGVVRLEPDQLSFMFGVCKQWGLMSRLSMAWLMLMSLAKTAS